jgi:hypothetical protein
MFLCYREITYSGDGIKVSFLSVGKILPLGREITTPVKGYFDSDEPTLAPSA